MQEVTDGVIQGVIKMPNYLLLELHSESGEASFLIWARIGFTNYAIRYEDTITWASCLGGFESNVAWLVSEHRECPVLLWFMGVESQMRLK